MDRQRCYCQDAGASGLLFFQNIQTGMQERPWTPTTTKTEPDERTHLAHQPVLEFETRHPVELPGIGSSQGQVEGDTGGCQPRVVHTDHLTPLRQVAPEGSVAARHLQIDFEHREPAQDRLDERQAPGADGWIRRTIDAMQQLTGRDDREEGFLCLAASHPTCQVELASLVGD